MKKEVTQIESVTPEEFLNVLMAGVKNLLDDFKKELEPNNKETYLTRLQTAKMLSISLTTLNDWSKKGVLIVYKMGNRTYYKLSEIEGQINNSNRL